MGGAWQRLLTNREVVSASGNAPLLELRLCESRSSQLWALCYWEMSLEVGGQRVEKVDH